MRDLSTATALAFILQISSSVGGFSIFPVNKTLTVTGVIFCMAFGLNNTQKTNPHFLATDYVPGPVPTAHRSVGTDIELWDANTCKFFILFRKKGTNEKSVRLEPVRCTAR